MSETVLRFTRFGVDSLTTLLLLGFGLLSVLQGKLSIGALTAFYALADRFADGCQKLQELLHEVYVIRPSCSRYFELLDRETAMPWADGATPARCGGAFERECGRIQNPARPCFYRVVCPTETGSDPLRFSVEVRLRQIGNSL